jgi:outer membrane protein assembly factor BamB
MLRAVLTLAFLSSAAVAADWPQWLGPKRDSGSVEKVEPWKEAPKQLWTAKIGAGFSCPIVSAGKVYLHARVANKQSEEMIAFDALSGSQIWRTAYERAPYSSVLNTGPQATPAVSGGKVFGYGITGMLTCFKADTGEILWKVDALKQFKINVPRFGVCCSPVVIGNRVIVAVGGKGSSIVAFDTNTGEVAWQALDEVANTSSPLVLAAKGKPVPDIVFMTTLRVVALNPLDGSVNWEFLLPFQPSGTAPTPILAPNNIFTSTMDNGTTAIRLLGTEKTLPEKAWQGKDLSGYFSTGVAASDKLYLVTNTLKPIPRADLVCVNIADGKEVWKKEGVGYFHFGMVRTGNDRLLVLDDAGNLKLLDSKANEYRELCQSKICDGTFVAPTLANGCVYARDTDKLVCVRLVP